MNSSSFRPKVALFFAATLVFQVCYPTLSIALTSGPTQPEFNGFEPVGASNNVDLQSGDFTYNIPLFELPGPDGGYPFNLAYHSGIGMEQEASWVGLGWSLTPGSITRDVRGIPDDFNGKDQQVGQNTYIKPDKTISGGLGINLELLGIPDGGIFGVNLGLGLDLAHNSYKGWTTGINVAPSAQIANFNFSTSLGLNSATGSTLSPTLSLSQKMSEEGEGSGSLSLGANFASGEGLTGINLGLSASQKSTKDATETNDGFKKKSVSGGASISYNDRGFTPAVTQPFRGIDLSGGVEIGAFFGPSVGGQVQGSFSRQAPRANGEWQKFNPRGFFHHTSGTEGAQEKTMLDFARENQSASRIETPNLAFASMQPDIYSVSGQGTGGQFIPMRSSIPVVGDATMQSSTVGGDVGAQVDPGGLALVGADLTISTSQSKTMYLPHDIREKVLQNEHTTTEGLKEPFYFRASGELSAPSKINGTTQSTTTSRLEKIGGDDPVAVKFDRTLSEHSTEEFSDDLTISSAPEFRDYGDQAREPRTQTLLPLKSGDLYTKTIIDNKEKIVSRLPEFQTGHYSFVGFDVNPVLHAEATTEAVHGLSPELNVLEADSRDLIAGFISTNSDGTRYNYGLPLWNYRKMEASFAVNQAFENCGEVDIPKSSGASEINNVANISDGKSNNNVNAFKSVTETPPFAHSYLLTNILGPDYLDHTNDGPTLDDTGYWVDFTYAKVSSFDSPYCWRAPFEKAAHAPGNRNDDKDDKASFVYGEREQAVLAEVRTKTHVARFYSSKRFDAKGARSLGRKNNPRNLVKEGNYSYRLDKIELRTHEDASTDPPILTVHFDYDETGLTPGVPNSDNGSKLKLKHVYTTYRGNERGKSTPYTFDYVDGSLSNRPYSNADYNKYVKNGQDRWGNNILRPNDQGCETIDDPYVVQDIARVENIYDDAMETLDPAFNVQEETNVAASAWHLNQITLPSGAEIQVHYESDDYAFVQDRNAMQMVPISGISSVGNYEINTDEVSAGSDDLVVYFDLERNWLDEELMPDDARAQIENYLEGLHGVNRKLTSSSSPLIGSQVLFKIESKLSSAAAQSEAITGYAEISGYGITEDYRHGYIELAPVALGKNNDKRNYHPFAAAAWQFVRTTYPNALQTNNYNSDADFFESLAQLGRSFTTVVDLFRNYYKTCSSRQLGGRIMPSKSYLRLCTPDGKKLGGGSRVKAIVVDDRWDHKADEPLDNGTPSYENDLPVRYGQVYDYTTLESGRRISSGVATNEPAIAYEECALQYAKIFTDEAIFRSDQKYSIEYPINKSILPGASVGYSEVTVRSLAGEASRYFQNESAGELPIYLDGFEPFQNHSFATSGETVTEYYTARDYPIITKETQIRKSVPLIPITDAILYKEVNSSFSGTQGYSTVINDMHGKMKATSHYGLNNNGARGERINETRYSYFSKESAHTVADQVIPTKEVVSTVPSVKFNPNGTALAGQEVELGVSHSMTWDMRHNSLNAVEGTVQANVFSLAIFPGMMVLPSATLKHGDTKTIVSSKVVRRSGILSQVQVTDGQSRQITRNVAFDPLTGNAALTTVTNSFDDEVYALDIPAYTQYRGMGPAYENQGAVIDFRPVTSGSQNVCDLYHFEVLEPGSTTPVASAAEYLKEGDVIMFLSIKTGAATAPVHGVNPIHVGRVEGNSVWLEAPETGNQLVSQTNLNYIAEGMIVRSGQRNQLSPSAGAIQAFANPLDYLGNVLSNSANTYNEFGGDRTFKIPVEPEMCYESKHFIYPYPNFIDSQSVNHVNDPCNVWDLKLALDRVDIEWREKNPTNPNWSAWMDAGSIPQPYAIFGTACDRNYGQFVIQKSTPGWLYQFRAKFIAADGRELGEYTDARYPESRNFPRDVMGLQHEIASPQNGCVDDAFVEVFYPSDGNEKYTFSTSDENHILTSASSIEARGLSSNASSLDFATGIANGQIAAPRFTDGERGIWRPHQSFVYVAERKSLPPSEPEGKLDLRQLRSTGIFIDENGKEDLQVPSFDHRIPMANLLNRQTDRGTAKYGWRLVEESTAYGNVKSNGEATESRDALGVYSSAQYGYGGYLAEAVASNARRTEMAAESFENFEIGSPIVSEGGLHFGAVDAENPVHTWSETYNIVAPYNPVGEVPGMIIDYTDFSQRAHVVPVAASVSLRRNPDNTGCLPDRKPAAVSDVETYFGYLSEANISTYSPHASETVVPYETELAILDGEISDCFEGVPQKCWWGQVTLYYSTDEIANPEQLPKAVGYSHTGRRAIEMPAWCNGTVSFPQNRLSLSTGKHYLASAWVRTKPNESGTSDLNPIEELLATEDVFGVSGGATVLRTTADQQLIEGWRRVEIIFEAGPSPINIDLTCGIAYDDVRVVPVDGSIQSYVYDPVDYKLRATLDENNFATFYQYDDQGILIGTLKETERGIRTIQETRSYTNTNSPQ